MLSLRQRIENYCRIHSAFTESDIRAVINNVSQPAINKTLKDMVEKGYLTRDQRYYYPSHDRFDPNKGQRVMNGILDKISSTGQWEPRVIAALAAIPKTYRNIIRRSHNIRRGGDPEYNRLQVTKDLDVLIDQLDRLKEHCNYLKYSHEVWSTNVVSMFDEMSEEDKHKMIDLLDNAVKNMERMM